MIWIKYTHLFSKLLTVILYYIFFNYVLTLEKLKCDCSKDWRRDYIKYYSTIAMVMIAIKLFNNKITEYVDVDILNKIYLLDFFAGFIYLYVLLTYSYDLKNSQCKCSESPIRTFIYHYSIIILVLYAIISIASLSAIIHTQMMAKLCPSRKISSKI